MNSLMNWSGKTDRSVGIKDGRTIHIQPTHVTNGIDVDHRHDLLHPMYFRRDTTSSQVVLDFFSFGISLGSLDDQFAGAAFEDDCERHRSPYEIVKQLKATLPFMYEVHQRVRVENRVVYREGIGMDKSIVHTLFGEQLSIK